MYNKIEMEIPTSANADNNIWNYLLGPPVGWLGFPKNCSQIAKTAEIAKHKLQNKLY